MLQSDPLPTRWSTHPASPALLQRMRGHAGAVQAVAFCPDGKRALSAATDGTLILWDVTTAKALHDFTGHDAPVTSVVVSHDGDTAFSGSTDGTIRRWRISDGLSTRLLSGHSAAVRSLQFTPQGSLLSASDDQTLRLWNLSTGTPAVTLAGHADRVTAVAVTPEGKWAISASDDHSIRVWSLADGCTTQIIACVGGFVSCLAVAADGVQLLTGSDDRLLRCWDLASGVLLATWAGHEGGVRSMALSRDGDWLLSADNNGVLCLRRLTSHVKHEAVGGAIADSVDGAIEATIQAHSVPITSLHFSPDGRQFLTGSQDHSIALWDRDRLGVPFRQGHNGPVTGLAVTPDGSQLVSCGEDGQLRLWETADGLLADRLVSEATPLCVAALPSSNAVLVGDGAGGLKKVGLENGRFSWPVIHFGEQRGAALEVAVSPDGGQLAVATDTWAVVVWDLHTGERRHVLAGHRASVLSLAFSPSLSLGRASRLLSGDENGVMFLWNLKIGQGMPFSAPFDGAVENVTISPDGRLVAVGLDDGTLTLLSFPDGVLLHRWKGHTEWVAGLAFDEGGERLFSAGGDGDVCVWRSSDAGLVSRQESGVPFSRLRITGKGVLVLGDEGGGLRTLDYSYPRIR